MMRFVAFMVIGLFFLANASAGQFNQTLSIGDKAPEWKDLPGTDGQKHSLADLKDKQAVVVVFTCNSCPVATDYEDRIIAIAKKYAGPDGKAAIVAINVNKIPEDSLDKMKERAQSKGFPFPYLYDETQKIAKEFGATYTPEFFVLDRERKVAYMGGMDDSSNPAAVKNSYLDPAIDAILKGSAAPTPETSAAQGCMIRYARERRR